MWRRILLVSCCLMGIVASGQTAKAQSVQPYEVYAVRYATIPDFPVAELVKGADPARKMDIAMIVPPPYTHYN